MKVSYEVDEEAQRLRADRLRKLMVGDDARVLLNLSDDEFSAGQSVAALYPPAAISMFT